ncbi:Protein detoxification 10 [Vitis vinifera]|uniref:Protein DETOXIFICATION n=1 Tax=Vitis vinifera TaxID=29760 RepID=A0A438HTF6_VITVI|nr:Protein detoxification 10 [Vitis vinifera]
MEMGGNMGVFRKELKKTSLLAAPMVMTTLLQYLMQVVSLMMVGHLGRLPLSAVAIATALTNVSGFSLLKLYVGKLMGPNNITSLETIPTVPLSLLLWFVFPSVSCGFSWTNYLFIGQDPLISLEARKYSVWLIPGPFGCAVLKPAVRYLQTQSLILPLLISSFIVLCFHVPICWILIFKLELGDIGAAVAFCLSNWHNVILLGLYVKYSSACEATRMKFSKETFLVIGEFFRFAVPAAVMVWPLPNPSWNLQFFYMARPQLQGMALEWCLCDCTFVFVCDTKYAIYPSILKIRHGMFCSNRVSNELGAGNSQAAQIAVWAVILLAVLDAVTVSTVLFSCRYVLAEAYSSDKQVVGYVAVMTPLICISIMMDSLQGVLSGLFLVFFHVFLHGFLRKRAAENWAYVNLGAFYFVGVPVAVILGFVLRLKGKRLWIGIVAGSVVQAALLFLITGFTNWKKQGVEPSFNGEIFMWILQENKARERMIEGASSAENRSN